MKDVQNKSKSTDLKLFGYSVSAIAALAISGESEATVVYSGLKNIALDNPPPVDLFYLDIDGNGVNDFMFSYYGFGFERLRVRQLASASIAYASDSGGMILLPGNYGFGQTIPSSVSNWGNAHGNLAYVPGFASSVGNFLGARGYIGIRFEIGADTHYGWIEFEGSADATLGTIYGWAYNDVADDPIFTGEGKPEPGTLLSLALGLGACAFAWKKSHRKVTT